MITTTETTATQENPAAKEQTVTCEECKIHEATRRIQIIVNRALKKVRYCAVCQENYFAALPINREMRRHVARQLRLNAKHEQRKARVKTARKARKAA